MVLASVSVGNPDTAAATAVMVPGMASSVKILPTLTNEASGLRDQTSRLMGGKPVAVVAWMGYHKLSNPMDRGGFSDAIRAVGDGDARTGAAAWLSSSHWCAPTTPVGI